MRALFLFCPVLLVVSGAAQAQEEMPRDTVTPLLLPRLTVTVLRTPIELDRAPYSIAVNTQHEIQRARAGLGLDEALRGIPGVQVDNRYNYALGERISVRGFGARSQFGVRGVRAIVDGIPATFADGQTTLTHVNLGFLRRVEVVRGPASALYGSSAAGVITFQSELPPPVPIAGEVQVTAGPNEMLRLQTTTGGRSGRASYLLNLSRLTYDGYRQHSDVQNFQLNGHAGYTRGRDEFRVVTSFVQMDSHNPGALSDELLAEDRFQAWSGNLARRAGKEERQGQVGLTWNRRLGAGDWELAAHAISRDVINPTGFNIIDLERTAGGVRSMFRSTPDADLLGAQWSVGVDADIQRDDRRNFGYAAPGSAERGDLTLDQFEAVTNAAAFVQLSVDPIDRLTMLAGLRYDWFRFSVDDRFITETNPDDSGNRVMDAVSPSIGMTYAFADWLNVFGNVASSFETPTTTELANRPDAAGGFNPDLDPQTAVSYEIGAKGMVARSATYQLSLYHADVRNELIPFEVPQAQGRQFFRNAGSTTRRGVEGAVSFSPAPRIVLRGAYTYTNARFDRYTVGEAVFDGNQVPGVAPHRGEVMVSYAAAAGHFAAIEGRYVSRTAADDANTGHGASYFLMDGRIALGGVRVRRIGVEPFAGVTNILDRKYITALAVNAAGARFFEPGPGRSAYIGLSAQVGR